MSSENDGWHSGQGSSCPARNVFRSEVSLESKDQQLEKQETEIQQSLSLAQAMRTIVDSCCDVVV